MEKHKEELNNSARAQAKEIWKLLEYIRGAAPISDYRSLAYAILFIRYMQDNSGQHFEAPRFYSFDVISQHIKDLVYSCTRLGLFPEYLGNEVSKLIEDILLKNNRIDEDSVRLAIQSNVLNKNKGIAKYTLSELNNLFAENESKSGSEFYTPTDVNRLVTALGIKYSPRTVCDPFAGGGSTAFSFHEAMDGKVSIDTQEMNPDVYFQLVITRILRQIHGTDFLGDSISNPKYTIDSYDLIATFPPFGLKLPKYTRKLLDQDKTRPWLSVGEQLPVSRADWLTTLSILPPYGSKTNLIIGMSLSALTRTGTEAFVRQVLTEQNLIDTVILLPKGIHYSTGIATVLLVFNMNPQKKEGSIRFVDASFFYEPRRGRNILSSENIDRIVESSLSDGRFSKTVTLEEIAHNKFNLNPSLYVEKTIKVSQVKLTNFRGYTDFTIPIHESLTVLVGENGAGKTSILEAISCGLGPFLTAMPEAKGKLIRKSDVYIGPNGVADFARISMDTASSLSWDLVTKGADRNTLAKIGTQALSDFANQIVTNDEEYPLIAYYGTNRALSSSNGKVSISPFEVIQRSEGYDSALDAKINYGMLKNWFSKIEVDELKLRDEMKDHLFIHPAKALITYAVKHIVTRAQDVTFDKNSNDVVVSWVNEDNECVFLALEQLSEGYRNMVALTIDLVRRAYLLNPTSEHPLDVIGVVLIDEIELHLHPRWQQTVLEDITKLFPNIQFIVTTHSPQVLTTVKGECIRVVSSSFRSAESVDSPYGGENSRVMKQILHVNSRPDTEVSEKLKEYFDLIELGKGEDEQAIALREELARLTDGTEPMLAEADLAIKRVNWMKSRKSK
ncbi:N-6 DNA methylase [Photobacterium damselae]|uniref:N-6 DNA methylase n=1 Tax=Photobacterium damselae TaxID=38293 RepID=UPI0010765550|nr:N-6 DNA methylase [Photobacterium damselae]MBE8127385.1 N-6 DNA methylase [Photobacterium damselae subsp. piscicida]